jgi:hypothetical protein
MRFRNRGRHTGPSSEGMKTMHNATEFSVTLTPELYEQLRDEARLLGLSIEWVVASLVADTIEGDCPEPALL